MLIPPKDLKGWVVIRMWTNHPASFDYLGLTDDGFVYDGYISHNSYQFHHKVAVFTTYEEAATAARHYQQFWARTQFFVAPFYGRFQL